MPDEEEAVAIVVQMVEHLCSRYGWQCDIDPSRSKANIMVRLRDGRMQKVAIFGRADMNHQPVLVFYSAVAKENMVRDHMDILKQNSNINHSHFAIVRGMLVVLDTQLVMTADYPEVAKKIENVAQQGDQYQKRFSGGMPW